MPPTPTPEQKHELACRQSIARLLSRSKMTAEVLQQANLSPHPVDLSRVVVEDLVVLMQGLAFLMDEYLVASGRAREIRFEEASGGNGRDGPALVKP